MSDGVDETQIGPLANYIESFQEIKMEMSNNTAEFGTIGHVTMISKSGTNQLHANVFDYYSTPRFRALDPFAPERATGISHTPGASIGGPVYFPKLYNGKDKTFFFFSFETSRGSATQQLLNPTVPLEAWRNGDFSGVTTPVRDPATGQQFPNNMIPAGRINAVSRKIQDRFYPMPNFGNTSVFASQNYRELKLRLRDPSTYWTTRGDHRFSDKDSLFGRFTFQRAYNRPYEGNLPTIGQRFQRRDNRAASVAYTHTFSPNLLNEFRWGFPLNNNPIEGPLQGNEVIQDLGLTCLVPDLPDVSGIFKVEWTGLGLAPITQVDYRRPGFRNFLMEFQEQLSWFRGRHNFKGGRWDTGFRLSYIGTNTRQGDYYYNYNSPVPDTRRFIEKPRPFPQYPAINYYTNGAGHQFNGLTAEAERRMSKGLYYQFSWAWARDIGDLERGQESENPFDRRRERAVWLDIPTHRLTANWIYEFPFGKGRKFLSSASRGVDLLVGGWELSGIYSYYSGQFLTPVWSGPDPTGTFFTSSSTPANVRIRADLLRDPNLPRDERTVNRWFDTGAFAAPQAGRFGTSAKGVIKGPWTNVWHMGVFTTFRFREKAPVLRWELSATNAFNHPNWSNPSNVANMPHLVDISQAATVGVISSVGGVNGASTGDQPYAPLVSHGLSR
jgi:hypothetical protein